MIYFKQDNNAPTEQEFRAKPAGEKISEVAAGFVPPRGLDKTSALGLLKLRIREVSPRRAMKKIIPWYWAAASVLAVALVAYFSFFISGPGELVAQNSQIKELSLPDGSLAVLNAGSKISYSEKNFTKNRKLNLSGEAFFEVKKGGRFIVKTVNGAVEVLGTQFNVASRNLKFNVECLSGRVGVSANSQYLEITAGQQAKMAGQELVKTGIAAPEKISSWMKGEFNFEDEPLVYIFEELERQFDVKFELPDIKSRSYTGGFSNQNLEEALAQVCIPMGLNYEVKKNKKVIIRIKS